jgi:hypothetical protein
MGHGDPLPIAISGGHFDYEDWRGLIRLPGCGDHRADNASQRSNRKE